MWKKRDYDLSFYFVNLLFRPNEVKYLGDGKIRKIENVKKKSSDKLGDTKFELLIWSCRKVKCVSSKDLYQV